MVDEVFYCDLSELEKLTFNIKSYLNKNKPVLIHGITESWECTNQWVNSESLNFDYLIQCYGNSQVPVEVGGSNSYSEQKRMNMTFAEYLGFLKSGEAEAEQMYLKDWHFVRDHPDHNPIYEVPTCFQDDWLNWWWDLQGGDDYRFVYLGPAGTRTALHHDVLYSYSWSANVCGRKHWVLFPPSETPKLLGGQGAIKGLPPDARPGQYNPADYPLLETALRYDVDQGPGDAIFVPSGWHHQVMNTETTLSINHNWFNAHNLNQIWMFLESELNAVRNSIEHLQQLMLEEREWERQCELLMTANSAMNVTDFYQLLQLKEKELSEKGNIEEDFDTGKELDENNDCRLQQISDVVQCIQNHPVAPNHIFL